MGNSRFQQLLAYLSPHRKDVYIGIVALFIVNGIGAYIPRLIGNSVDELRGTLSFEVLLRYVFLIGILASIMWVIRMVSRITIFGIGRKVEFDLKQRIFQHLLRLEPGYFSSNSTGDLINRATSDVDNIRRLLGFAVLSSINTVFAYGLTLPFMLAINVRLTLATIAIYPLMLIAVQLFSAKLQAEQRTVQERLSDLSQLIQEDMSGISLIKIYAQEVNERLAFRRKNEQLLSANLKLARTRNVLFPVVEGLSYLSLLILLWLGSSAIANNTISVGDFVALITYVERLVFPTALLGFTITTYQRGEVSIERVEAIFDVQPQIKDRRDSLELPLERVKGAIAARDLSYTYPGAKNPALKQLNFTIQSGEKVAIVGSIGSGKSTLANVIPRLLDLQSGQLFLDEYDVTEVKLADLRRAIAYVPQDSFLFSTTIQNNIRYGEPVAEQPIVESAAKIAQIHPEIQNFPKEYNTLVGERGITLSGGQRQRTSLARALLIDAPVLILDDALSSVDNQTATQILDNLSQGVQRKTVIFISHQLSAAATADRIFVMDAGEIVQIGTHEDLVESPGLYQSLWQQHQLEEVLQ
ncbi:MAG: ABC transporter ATP-binding protein [Oscillatoria sp. PMC 1068.18]|nr:ABC transporter ATP-binding protein [Oscillatoria sp. PMC 1076.18]MEC4991391.1 ABC transporter ATP-binding protein [Oscillatoria sp. PMC 1068.18]